MAARGDSNNRNHHRDDDNDDENGAAVRDQPLPPREGAPPQEGRTISQGRLVAFLILTLALISNILYPDRSSSLINDIGVKTNIVLGQNRTRIPDTDDIVLRTKTTKWTAMHNSTASLSAPSFSLPLLSELINETTWQIKAPASVIANQLDFIVIGHAKTGTSFIQNQWFPRHPQIRLPNRESCSLLNSPGGAAKIVKLMYSLRKEDEEEKERKSSAKLSTFETANRTTTATATTIYGYKCPGEIKRPNSLLRIREFFPHTKLIVGLRHPVWWFQSFYNFRNPPGKAFRNNDNSNQQNSTTTTTTTTTTLPSFPLPNELIGVCTKQSGGVCTDESNFHYNLATLGLTNRSTTRERQLLSTMIHKRNFLPWPGLAQNPIFLYEQRQLDASRDAQVSETLRQDMSHFLGLDTPLPPLTKAYAPPRHKTLHICEPQYDALRHELVRIGTASSTWIMEFFLDQPTVTLSSRRDLEALLDTWRTDPCS